MAGALSNMITKMSFFNVSKAFPQPSFRPKVSRVCFTSASKYSQGQSGDPSEDTSDSDREFDELAQKTRDNMKAGMEKTKGKAQEMSDKTKGQAYDMKEATKETAGNVTDKAKQGADAAKSAKEKTKDQAYNMKEKTKEAAETVSDKAAKTVGGMWEAAKDTTQKIKETVVGKDDKETMERKRKAGDNKY